MNVSTNKNLPNGQAEEKADYFYHIREIGEIIKQSGGMNELFYEFAEPHLAFISERLEITHVAATLFAALINMYNGHNVDMNNLAAYLKLRSLEIISFLDELEEMERKELIEIDHGIQSFNPMYEILSFKVPFKTINCIRKGSFRDLNKASNLSFIEFFDYLDEIFEKNIPNALPYKNKISRMTNLLQDNKNLMFVQKILNLALYVDDTLLLLYFFHNAVSLEFLEIEVRCLAPLYENRSMFNNTKRQLINGSHILLKRELIENACGDGFFDTEAFSLTDKTKEEFLGEFDRDLSSLPIKGIKCHGSIAEKKLFYPQKTETAISKLSELLQKDRFLNVKKRLSENRMRTGFACLFSGAPGTGKTETAYQIARQTGRDLMQIDIASVKSKWFGDSEKQIKGIFDKYRACVRKLETMPILLFNEADAIFGKRRLLQENYSGPGQTENAMQNIILQELENLDGILIATTNLSVNMDAAFERRFLYKIEFEKPEIETRKVIWLSMVDGLSGDNALVLAEKYDFSGGQIENIARKAAVHFVLSGNFPSLQNFIRFCDEENSGKKSGRIIGFAA